jgi:single-strand DNA-binding protein
MNRWTGTGHLTKDPKFLETENGTAICTLRIAVKRAGKQGHDGYFDVKCFDAQASACAQYLKAGREVAVDGRLLFDEFQTQDGSYASRIYVVASASSSSPAASPPTVRPATRPPPTSPPPARRARPTRPPDHHRGPAAPLRPGARRLPRDSHDHYDRHPSRDRDAVPRRACRVRAAAAPARRDRAPPSARDARVCRRCRLAGALAESRARALSRRTVRLVPLCRRRYGSRIAA